MRGFGILLHMGIVFTCHVKSQVLFFAGLHNIRPRFFHSVLSSSFRDYRSIDLDDIRRNEAIVSLRFCWQCAGR